MKAVTTVPSFVEPSFKSELGEFGLGLHEIASSLGAEYSHVRVRFEKLIRSKSLKLKYLAITRNNNNGMLINSYVLSTAAAKFLVAKYDNEAGNGYLMFLIARDEALTRFEQKQASPKLPATFAEALRLAADQADHIEQLQAELKQIDQMINLDQWFTVKLSSYQKGKVFKRLVAAGIKVESRHINGCVHPTKLVSKGDLEKVFPNKDLN